jgi:hypothetical protein
MLVVHVLAFYLPITTLAFIPSPMKQKRQEGKQASIST